MKTIIIANNLLIEKSPAFGIEQDLLDGISTAGVEIEAYSSSVGDLGKSNGKYKNVVVREYKSVLYALSLMGKLLPDIQWLPDATYYSWGQFVAKQICSQPLDNAIIHSIGFANACHWAAYKVKKHSGLPWVASFFDSWTDYPTRRFNTSFFKRKDESMERSVAEKADIIVHNNYETAKIWKDRYGDEISKKIVVIPFNIDFSREHASVLDTSNKDVLNINHIGTFYPYRNASSIIRGVARFVEKYPQEINKIKINLVGKVLDSDIELMKALKIDWLFSIVGRLTPEQCQAYYRDASAFLSTAGDYGENVMFPSKIIKYFYYNRPIIGVSPSATITESELIKAGHRCFLPSDSDGFADYLHTMINNYKSVCNFNHDYWKRFSNETVVSQYINIYNSLVNRVI